MAGFALNKYAKSDKLNINKCKEGAEYGNEEFEDICTGGFISNRA